MAGFNPKPRFVTYSFLSQVLEFEEDYYTPQKGIYKFSNGREFDAQSNDPYKEYMLLLESGGDLLLEDGKSLHLEDGL